METKPYSLQAPEQIAKEYGGNKRAIAQAAQQGLLDPTAAILAGMFIDRIRNAASTEQAPTQTVAQDVMAPPQMPQGQMPPQMGVPSQPPMGLPDIPIPENMYEPSYAGGGIVAFAKGDEVKVPSMLPSGMRRQEDPQVLRAYYISRGLPVPPELMSEAEKAAAAKPPYPAGVFPKVGRFFSDIGESVGSFVSPGGADFYSDQPTVTPQAAVTTSPSVAAMPDQSQAEVNRLLSKAPSSAPAASPAAPSAPSGQNMADIIRQSQMYAEGIMGKDRAKPLTTKEAAAGVDELLRESGFDTGLLARQQEQLETEKQSLAKDRKTAMDMRIIEAGLGIMAGESPHAFVNIGKGATPAVQGLAKDIKDLKAVERSLTKSQMDLDTKKNDFALGKAKMTQGQVDKAQERVDRDRERFQDLQGRIGNTMLAGELQRKLQETGGGATDFGRKWQIYVNSLPPGEKPTPEGFTRVWGRPDSATEIQQINTALKAYELGMSPAEIQSMRSNIFGGRAPTTGRYQEGQKAKDTTGKPIVFRNGQWVYE